MNRWIVLGADKHTGEARTIAVTAELRVQAEMIASRQGLLIESINQEAPMELDVRPARVFATAPRPERKKTAIGLVAFLLSLAMVMLIAAWFDISAAREFVIAAIAIAAMLSLFWLAGLPGRIARDRDHPNTEAITICGYVGAVFLGIFWLVALIWAFTGHPKKTA